ncbi:hypothetical protein EST38_g12827 [Candolleomyces aberdarensis]|uniref:Protein kinase domain-containing protein n=1 Tax=Candolleomyces aberdarensis TaxID=2316362 RepID=A0A4V1Q1W7_9AGAR|nr:hypothetical protein EST38_g12827 [Candolleomyces aberdarensis]
MRQIVSSVANAVELAGTLAGVPYIGPAAGLLQDIILSCDEIRTHKKKAKRIRSKCAHLIEFLNDQSPKMEGTGLLEAFDEAEGSLQAILTRIQRLTGSSSFSLFLKARDVAETLDQCEFDLETTTTLLNTKAQMKIATTQYETKELVNSTRADVTELKDLVFQLLASKLDNEQIVTLTTRDPGLAARLMEAGQKELQCMKGQRTIPIVSESVNPASNFGLQSQGSAGFTEGQYQKSRDALFSFHLQTGTLPTIKVLDEEITKTSELAVAGGIYSDIWLGKWLGNQTVALKALRHIKANDSNARQRFEHEIQMWSMLRNEHILPFYGIVTNLGRRVHMVSPWQEHGNVLEFIKAHPNTDRLRLARGAATGLEYLHAHKIVHGNVKCTNILVTDKGEACICDFGMSKLVEEVTEKSASATLTAAGSARWLAPELIEGSVSSPTFASDTYSFGMAILELFTGKYPFAERKRDASVIHDVVVSKKVPQRPREAAVVMWLTDEIWSLMERCWQHNGSLRPQMEEVKRSLESLTTTTTE